MTNPDASPASPSPTSAVPPQGMAPTSGLAVAALIVGIIAFVSGLAPVWGLLAGSGAVILAILALARKQNKVLAIIGAVLGGLALITSLGTTIALVAGIMGFRPSASVQPDVTTSESSATPEAEAASDPSPTPSESVAPEPAAPAETVSQSNAKRSAQDYLNYTAFSRSGLIDQLVYEGFSVEDATYGVDAVGADWNEQAAASAQAYLDYTSFSHSGLVDQLVYEGFTQEEAEYGVSTTGL